MKQIKRMLIMLLALTLCLGSLYACKSDADGGDDGKTTTTADPNPEPAPTPTISLVEAGQTKYTIIYSSKGENWELAFANKLASMIKDATGAKPAVKKDKDVALTDGAKEIIIGTATNNRSTLYGTDQSYQFGYLTYVKGNSLIIEAGSKTGAYFAMYQLFADQYGIDLQADSKAAKDVEAQNFTVAVDYKQQKTLTSVHFPYIGIEADDFRIVNDGQYVNQCLSYELQNKIKSWIGMDLTVGRISTGYKDQYGYFVFNADENFKNGDWDITVTGNKVMISAGDYQGFNSAITRLSDYRHTDGYMMIGADDAAKGNFIDNLPQREQDRSSKYTYNRLGEHRVMFYNALWGDQTGQEDRYTNGKWDDIPAKDRNQLQAVMIGEYMPDVLGLQEMGSTTKRGSNGSGELIALLANLGYAEAVDPRVKNLYATDEIIPGTDNGAVTGKIDTVGKINEGGKNYNNEFNNNYANRVSGNPIYGYGTGGGIRVTVGGNTFYTTFNSAPLLYNTNTTELIHAEYYWYKYQTDMRTYDDCTLCQNGTHKYADAHHPNTASDAASKCATWGIFRSKETGEVYIAISTHMCTRSNYIRGLQAREVIKLIEDIKAMYPQYANAPVFFGGDMNGNYDDLNYQVFAETNSGLKSLQDYKDGSGKYLATEYTSQIITSHGYPIFDREDYVMTPGEAFVSGNTIGNSIDQVYVANETAMEVHVYGIIADFCTLRSSDHLPLLVDFTIK